MEREKITPKKRYKVKNTIEIIPFEYNNEIENDIWIRINDLEKFELTLKAIYKNYLNRLEKITDDEIIYYETTEYNLLLGLDKIRFGIFNTKLNKGILYLINHCISINKNLTPMNDDEWR